jgi:small subunit ribosomal protein S17e
LGKVRPERVKRIARELMDRFPDKFTADFKANKESVKALIKTSSPKLRNRIAGYITRLVSVEQAAEGVEGVEATEEETLAEEEAESIEMKETEGETGETPPPPDEKEPEKKKEG